MSKKNQATAQEEQVATTVSSLEAFLKNNAKAIEWVIIAVAVAVCAILAINKWYLEPLQEEARGQMFNAEQQFRDGNYQTALSGDGNALGFEEVIANYGAKAGRSVYLYAGICALQTGDNEGAISYLKKYSTRDAILRGRALCCTGDAYSNLGDYATAVSFYRKAAAAGDNQYAAGYLLKAGVTLEEMGDSAAALKCYEQIKSDYPQTIEGYEIDKYISHVKGQN